MPYRWFTSNRAALPKRTFAWLDEGAGTTGQGSAGRGLFPPSSAGPPHPVWSNLERGSPCRALEASGNSYAPSISAASCPPHAPSLPANQHCILAGTHSLPFIRFSAPPLVTSSDVPTPTTNALSLASGGGVVVGRRVDRSLQRRLWCVRENDGTVLVRCRPALVRSDSSITFL